MPNYTNSVVYQCCCDEPEITDIYVGSTTNFKVRKTNTKAHVAIKMMKNIKEMCTASSENMVDGRFGP
jgi:hypothetical protein